jgi:hypothetical protein
MTKLLTPANSNFLLMEHPVNMHGEVIQWVSELEFCNVELRFLKKLLRKYFLNTGSKKKLAVFYTFELKLKKFHEKNYKQMYDAVVVHEHQLSELDKDKFSQNQNKIINQHKKHKLGVTAFMESVKKIKLELYDFVEKQMIERKKIINGYEEGTITL